MSLESPVVPPSDVVDHHEVNKTAVTKQPVAGGTTTSSQNMTANAKTLKEEQTSKSAVLTDAPTHVTNSNTSSETASLPDEQRLQQLEQHGTTSSTDIDAAIAAQEQLLAKQLEFYFSSANLPRDTYLQTLQSLNDGYVPLSIIANFSKVQAICGASGGTSHNEEAICRAVSQHLVGVLEIVSISTVTNKKVTNQDNGEGEQDHYSILAIGPCCSSTTSRSNIERASPLLRNESATPSSPPRSPIILNTPRSPIQNTIILRDVPDGVTEEHVRSLFHEVKSPPLQQVYLDVANCWFVTLDTSSREAMVNVMLDLKKQTFGGEAVKARLKAVATPTPADSFIGTLDPNAIAFPAIHCSSPPSPSSRNKKNQQGGGGGNNGKSTKTRSRNRRKNSNKNSQPPHSPVSPKKQNQQHQQSSSTQTTASAPPPPPLLEEESHFPSLAATKIVDKVGSDADDVLHHDIANMGINKPTSSMTDGASTTTTTSSTTSSTSVVPVAPVATAGGYAAALLKAAPPRRAESSLTARTTTASSNKSEGTPASSEQMQAKTEGSREEMKLEPKEEIAPMPMSWGSGRSFAQVLKKEEQSS